MSTYIKIQNLSLNYPIYDYRALSLKFALRSLASAGTIMTNEGGIPYVRSLENINLSLQPGDRLALIGGNGAGKTTLLKVIAGIYEPTTGSCEVKGKMTTLLGTGFGLDEEATGYQNIILGGIALGYRLKEMKAAIEGIAEFSELGNFLEMPLRTYSAGMKARLAFAIATCNKPDIVLLDEGIGAGDASFYEKANERLKGFLSDASIMILASHSNALLRNFCNKCLILENGHPLFFGDLQEGLKIYEAPYAKVLDAHQDNLTITGLQTNKDVSECQEKVITG
jgi:ABC-2 type transport system ATP-binding protein/lipopolysaccharide transport system ATP-binding protein